MNTKYAGVKFICVAIEIIVLAVICAYVITKYYPDNALIGLSISMVGVMIVSLATLALAFDMSLSDVWSFITDSEKDLNSESETTKLL